MINSGWQVAGSPNTHSKKYPPTTYYSPPTMTPTHLQELFSIMTQLKTPQEAEKFLTDILTPQELESIAERWQIAKLLLEGKMSQREIQENLGTAVATITRGNRMIKYGSGGFKTMYTKTKN